MMLIRSERIFCIGIDALLRLLWAWTPIKENEVCYFREYFNQKEIFLLRNLGLSIVRLKGRLEHSLVTILCFGEFLTFTFAMLVSKNSNNDFIIQIIRIFRHEKALYSEFS